MASASIPPSPPPPRNSGALLGSSAVVTTKEFSHSISQKLSNSNYLPWCQQVELVLKGHRLYHLLTKPQIPPRYLTIANCDAGVTSPEFLLWEQQDQLLLSWLQSTISGEVLPARSVIGMVMKHLTVIKGTMMTMFLLSLWSIPTSILIRISLRPQPTPISIKV
ncbi:hypothetical protein HKD37_03G007893 [Glycine soja]